MFEAVPAAPRRIASNVSGAMGLGKRAARAIDERLMGSSRLSAVLPTLEFDQSVPEQAHHCARHDGHHTPVAARVRSTDEVVAGLTAGEAKLDDGEFDAIVLAAAAASAVPSSHSSGANRLACGRSSPAA